MDMTDLFSWANFARWLVTLTQRFIPDRVLRWAWSDTELLARIDAVHFNSAPHFYVHTDRDRHELESVGFDIFNLSPFTLAIVGVDVRVYEGDRLLFRHEQRLPAEIPIAPYARSGFNFAHMLIAGQVARLRSYPRGYAMIRVDGAMILRTPFGERRKNVVADVVALIDR
jgi:hypothetical protein